MDTWFIEKYKNISGIGINTKRLIHSEQSDFQKIEVFETEGMGNLLLLDGMIMCTETDEFVYHELIAHVPCNIHPNPKKALVIGGGDGGTVRELTKYKSLEQIDLCEIDGRVIEVSKLFFPHLTSGLIDKRVNIHVKDGIDFVKKASDASYDIIIIDSSEPEGPSAVLFTDDFYSHVKRVLTENGVMTAQTQTPFLNEAQIRPIYQRLHHFFPKTQMMVGPVTTYPSGYWSWCCCSKTYMPTEIRNTETDSIVKQTKYYNRAIHQATFALPNFVAAMTQPSA